MSAGVESGPRTILAVDDERTILSLLASMLERNGFRVLKAAGGQEALEILKSSHEVDLVITDIVMPDMDGTALAQKVLATHPEMPVLFISGFPNRLQSLEAPVLAKPFTSAALIGKVRTLLKTN